MKKLLKIYSIIFYILFINITALEAKNFAKQKVVAALMSLASLFPSQGDAHDGHSHAPPAPSTTRFSGLEELRLSAELTYLRTPDSKKQSTIAIHISAPFEIQKTLLQVFGRVESSPQGLLPSGALTLYLPISDSLSLIQEAGFNSSGLNLFDINPYYKTGPSLKLGDLRLEGGLEIRNANLVIDLEQNQITPSQIFHGDENHPEDFPIFPTKERKTKKIIQKISPRLFLTGTITDGRGRVLHVFFVYSPDAFQKEPTLLGSQFSLPLTDRTGVYFTGNGSYVRYSGFGGGGGAGFYLNH